MKRKSFPVTNIGSVSLLMIFIVLCMVTFAALSLSAAISDQKFSAKMAKHTTQYYQASNSAESVISDIDSILNACHSNASDAISYNALIKEHLGRMDALKIEDNNSNIIIRCQFPINDSLALSTVFSVNPYEKTKNGFYKVLSWKEVATKEWTGDNSLNLIH